MRQTQQQKSLQGLRSIGARPPPRRCSSIYLFHPSAGVWSAWTTLLHFCLTLLVHDTQRDGAALCRLPTFSRPFSTFQPAERSSLFSLTHVTSSFSRPSIRIVKEPNTLCIWLLKIVQPSIKCPWQDNFCNVPQSDTALASLENYVSFFFNRYCCFWIKLEDHKTAIDLLGILHNIECILLSMSTFLFYFFVS